MEQSALSGIFWECRLGQGEWVGSQDTLFCFSAWQLQRMDPLGSCPMAMLHMVALFYGFILFCKSVHTKLMRVKETKEDFFVTQIISESWFTVWSPKLFSGHWWKVSELVRGSKCLRKRTFFGFAAKVNVSCTHVLTQRANMIFATWTPKGGFLRGKEVLPEVNTELPAQRFKGDVHQDTSLGTVWGNCSWRSQQIDWREKTLLQKTVNRLIFLNLHFTWFPFPQQV